MTKGNKYILKDIAHNKTRDLGDLAIAVTAWTDD